MLASAASFSRSFKICTTSNHPGLTMVAESLLPRAWALVSTSWGCSLDWLAIYCPPVCHLKHLLLSPEQCSVFRLILVHANFCIRLSSDFLQIVLQLVGLLLLCQPLFVVVCHWNNDLVSIRVVSQDAFEQGRVINFLCLH